MSKAPQLAPLEVDFSRVTELLTATQSALAQPTLLTTWMSFGHHPKLLTISTAGSIDGPVN